MSKARGLAALGNAYSDGALSNRNMVTNGSMAVAQRGTSFTGWTNYSGAYVLDRWKYTNYDSGVVTISQDSDAPAGFSKSLKVATTATYSSSSTYSFLQQAFEGQDVSFLDYNTSSPQPVTVSFWIKSNMVGTYTFNLTTHSAGRRIASTYTVDAADTWERKTITFEGDTASSIAADSSKGIIAEWWFAAGSAFTSSSLSTTWAPAADATRTTGITVGLNTSTSNYINITGVQLELGDTATPFEHRSYGDELARCQRYFYRLYKTQAYQNLGNASMFDANNIYVIYQWPVVMRANPTVSLSSALDFNITGNSSDLAATSYSVGHASPFNAQINLSRVGLTNGYAYWVRMAGGGADASKFLQADAEL